MVNSVHYNTLMDLAHAFFFFFFFSDLQTEIIHVI